MEFHQPRWSCSWNSDQNCTQNFAGVLGVGGSSGGRGFSGWKVLEGMGCLMTVWYEIDPLCMIYLSEIKDDDPKIVILFYFQWLIQDFSWGWAPIPKVGVFCNFFAENCMKMKEFGPKGGHTSWAPPLDPPMISMYLFSLFDNLMWKF